MNASSLRAGAALLALALAACERPPVETVQTGYRGTGMVQVYNPRTLAARVAALEPPEPLPPAPPGPPGEWVNAQVLGDLSTAEMYRLMGAITQWVAPQQGCIYCHVQGADGQINFASDSIYTKVVSRRMIQMTRAINSNFVNHVGTTGVTCYSCHLGRPVPPNVWFLTGAEESERYYLDRPAVRVAGDAAIASVAANRTSIKQTEYTYALMIDMSSALGVNCTFCHNSPRWASWENSTPQRITALRGARMTRHLNQEWIAPLHPYLPETRLGPLGDVPKINCATCHSGAYKPLYGANLVQHYPALAGRPTPNLPPDTLGGPTLEEIEQEAATVEPDTAVVVPVVPVDTLR